jgi:uncharacterized SAM-binding protein YcdF (DUF218 family)
LFFYVSKALAFFLVPSNIVFIAIVAGTVMLFTRWLRAGRWLLGAGVVLFVIAGVSPLSLVLIKTLEDRFPVWDDTRGAPAGFIVLGGAIDPTGSALRKTVKMDGNAERLTIVAELARKYPSAKIVYSGGNSFGGPPEADYVLPLFESFGISPERVMLERDSRNTAENAEFSKAMLKPKPGDHWVIITSAIHMPRSIGSFRAAGFDVEALPVDWQTSGIESLFLPSRYFLGSLGATDAATREYIGLLAYWLTGRSPQLFPAPR